MQVLDPGRLARPASPGLNEALAFESEEVLDGIRKAWNFTAEEAAFLFRELRAYLWLAAQHPTRSFPLLASGLHVLDHVWHSFLLYTRVYRRFCENELGRFVHHQRRRARPSGMPGGPSELGLTRLRREVEQFRRCVASDLGPDFSDRWFRELPRQYPLSLLESLRRPVDWRATEYTRLAEEAA